MTTKDLEKVYDRFFVVHKFNQLLNASKGFCFGFSAKNAVEIRYFFIFVKPSTVYAEVLALSILGKSVFFNEPLILTENETYGSILSRAIILVKSLANHR